MKKVLDFLDNFEERAITVILPLMVFVVFMATFFRFTKLMIIPWSEELARYLMIWIVFLGIGVGAKNNAHFTVDNFVNALPKSTHKASFILRTIIIVGFCGFMTYTSIGLVQRLAAMGQRTPALQLPTWAIYSAIPVGLTLMVVRSLQYAIRKLKTDEEA
ncbi:MAG: TRAP transporter small permease [Sedimentibacter sp.]